MKALWIFGFIIGVSAKRTPEIHDLPVNEKKPSFLATIDEFLVCPRLENTTVICNVWHGNPCFCSTSFFLDPFGFDEIYEETCSIQPFEETFNVLVRVDLDTTLKNRSMRSLEHELLNIFFNSFIDRKRSPNQFYLMYDILRFTSLRCTPKARALDIGVAFNVTNNLRLRAHKQPIDFFNEFGIHWTNLINNNLITQISVRESHLMPFPLTMHDVPTDSVIDYSSIFENLFDSKPYQIFIKLTAFSLALYTWHLYVLLTNP